jgi:peptidoglycan hydrolase-like protein with peptidoglycan-binding domain
MKRIILPLAFFLLGSAGFANDQVRNVQSELKSLGFYYGDVNGQTNAETTAAIRRYQIRNGLEVTGSLNKETLAAIGMGPDRPAATKAPPAIRAVPAPPAEGKSPAKNLRRNESVEESDRNFLRRQEGQPPPPDAVAPLAPNAPASPDHSSVIDPPVPLDAPSPDFPVLFAGTPLANAPLGVQQQALRRVQTALANRGFYREVIDGLPGPATEEALLSFQHAQRLTLTGRLDLETLAHLRLLPNTATYSGAVGSRSPKRVYRGIWINKGGLRFGVEFN